MKKIAKLLIVSILFVTSIVALLIGCKKEDSPMTKDDAVPTEQNMFSEEQKILGFLADYDAMKRGIKADNEPVCIEDALWYWETTLNYCHGFAHEMLSNMRMDTVRIPLPKTDEEGKIDYFDVMETYTNLVNAVCEAYKSIDMDGKTLQLVMVRIEEGKTKDNEAELVVLMNTGSNSYGYSPMRSSLESPWYEGPFDKNDNWIWGLEGGRCDSTIMESDASDQLTLAIAYYDFIHGSTYVPCSTCYTYFLVGPNIEALYSGNPDSIWPFYDSDLMWNQVLICCIQGEELEMYYEEIMQNTHTENMETNPYGYYGYYKTEVLDWVLGNDYLNNHIIRHDVYVLFATKVWRSNDGSYPIPIDEEDDE